jgi:hypothetical protein
MRYGRDAGFDRVPEMVMTARNPDKLPAVPLEALMISLLFIVGDENPDDNLS